MTASIVQRLPGVLQLSSDIRRCWALPAWLSKWAAGTFERRNVQVDGGRIVGVRFSYGKLPYRSAPFMVQMSTLTLWPLVNSSSSLCLRFHPEILDTYREAPVSISPPSCARPSKSESIRHCELLRESRLKGP
jgi:hypothetical protein